jgi:CubicO group peptidase (beta-lactamase class C family)
MNVFDRKRLKRIEAALAADVAAEKIPGAVVLIAHDGKLVYECAVGFRDRAAGAPMEPDAIFRGASMTKPVVAVAGLMLVEEGKLQLWDPVAAYLPELAGLRVGMEGEPPARPMTVQDLFRHTSGFTYGKFGSTPVHAAYIAAGVGAPTETNEAFVHKLATLPLLYHPGTMFEYGVSIDVLGRIVEVLDGRELDAALEARIFAPLGMRDTGFRVPAEKLGRLAEPHRSANGTSPLEFLYDPDSPPRFYSGGGGMLTTAHDYLRFSSMLLGAGEHDGVRLLARKTVALMTSNHLPPGCGYGSFTRTLGITAPLPEYGQGFGLGVNVRLEAGRNPNAGSAGDFCWSGISGTYFWVDPVERITAILMLQAPEVRVHYRALLRDLVYGALR